MFADIDPETFNIDPHQVEARITPRTRAIMPVHLFGQCCDMEPLWKIAERHQIPLIEDAAQAFGSEYQGKRTGTLGAMACHSFYPTKNLGAFGDAGMVITNDREWAAKLMCLRGTAWSRAYYHKYLGWNSRLDALQAAILRVKMAWINRFIDARMAIGRRDDFLIDEQQLGGLIQKPIVLRQCKHTYNQYVIRVAGGQRDAMIDHFKREGIGFEIYYPLPLHLQEVFAPLGYAPGDFPVAELRLQGSPRSAAVPRNQLRTAEASRADDCELRASPHEDGGVIRCCRPGPGTVAKQREPLHAA